MTSEVDIFKDSNKLAVNNRADGFSHTVTGSSTTSKRISIKGGMFRLIVNGQELDKSIERHLDVVLVNAATSVHRMFFKELNNFSISNGQTIIRIFFWHL